MTWTDDLIAKYPTMLGNVYCGFDAPNGWQHLLEELCADLDTLNFPRLRVAQVKEKFGSLRFYIDIAGKENNEPPTKEDELIVDAIHALISEAEIKSAKICEDCGSSATIKNTTGWMTCICETCQLKRSDKNSKHYRGL